MQKPEYRYEIMTDNLRKAATKAAGIMIELLEEVWSDNDEQPEEQATIDLVEGLKRYRDEFLLSDDLAEADDEGMNDPAELVE